MLTSGHGGYFEAHYCCYYVTLLNFDILSDEKSDHLDFEYVVSLFNNVYFENLL